MRPVQLFKLHLLRQGLGHSDKEKNKREMKRERGNKQEGKANKKSNQAKLKKSINFTQNLTRCKEREGLADKHR